MVISPFTTICTPTQADYDELMEFLEELGYTWQGIHPATKGNYWSYYGCQTAINTEDSAGLGYCEIAFYKKHAKYTLYTLEEFFSLVGHTSSVNPSLIETWPW